jgi:RNA polymerase sigma factor (TIGR02999 family)
MDAIPNDLDRLFAAYAAGDPEAFQGLVGELYGELKQIARGQLRRARPGILQTTALVHEAYLKLAAGRDIPLRDREHFFAVCARAMRQLVVDEHRARMADKRGAGAEVLPIETGLHLVAAEPPDLERVNEALERLEAAHPRLVRQVELRVFAGFSEAETAELLGATLRTTQRDWQRARAWLRVELEGGA